ncbi:hypothetical protein KY308_03980, partial [Candidatus Woesearchaeota archaeon]|nr:hypothetical protein [Candidatus Woesearchaeota archaeon]
MVYYITHAEPVNVQSGNLARFFLRNFDEKEGRGHSLFIEHPFDLIVPSFEMPFEEAKENLKNLIREFPDFKFELKNYSHKKEVIWAILEDKKRRKELPKYFLKNKSSASMLLRFFFPPFMAVDPENFPPKELKFVDPEIVLMDTKCAIDIETTDYNNPDLEERITNAVINFGPGSKKVIFTTFQNLKGINEKSGYNILVVNDTDAIKQRVAEEIIEEDPLLLYGFNFAFDQEKLRELGESDFRVGVDGSVPVFKSVQALRNMIEKGRFVVDLYGYLFYHRNIYKDNRLATHCCDTKSLSHVELEAKTKVAESKKRGSREAAEEIISYVVDDGEMTFGLGESYVKEIIAKSWFAKREPSTICTTSGKNISVEMWKERYFHKRSTFLDRYDHG